MMLLPMMDPSWCDLVGLVVVGQFFQALLGGISQGSRAERSRLTDQANTQAELENRLLLELAKSPDPKVQAMALTGLLTGNQTKARGKKGVSGLGGFITEIAENPILGPLEALLQTPAQEAIPGQPDVEGFLGSSGVTTPISSPNAQGAAALAPRSALEGVAGQSPVQQLPPFQPVGGQPIGRPTQLGLPAPGPLPQTPDQPAVPRQIFRDPAQEAIDLPAQQFEALVQTFLDLGLPEEQAIDRATAMSGGGAGAQSAAFQQVEGTVPNPNGDGTRVPKLGAFNRFTSQVTDPNTGEPLLDFQPGGTGSTSRSFGVDRDAVSLAEHGQPFDQLTQSQQLSVNKTVDQQKIALAFGRRQATDRAEVESFQFQTQQTQRLADEWAGERDSAREMQQQFAIMEAGLASFRSGNRPAGAQAVLVTFQKILDPESVVRESEYARSAAGLSALGRFRGFVEQLTAGGAGVPEDELAKFVDTAKDFLTATTRGSDGVRRRLEASMATFRANGVTINPSEVFFDEPLNPTGGPPPLSGAESRTLPGLGLVTVGETLRLDDGTLIVVGGFTDDGQIIPR